MKQKFAELKTEAKYTDKKRDGKKLLEEKVVTNLQLTKLETKDLANTTTTATLKVADLKRFVVSDSEDGVSWYDDNTLVDNKLSFKSYSFMVQLSFSKWRMDIDKDYKMIM